MAKIRVLVVDDSSVVRSIVSDTLNRDPMIEVVGTAVDPYEAREKIKALAPDVLTLDVEMPRMDGITFLKNLMRLRPMPVVMLSSLTTAGSDTTLDALAIGAIDFIAKPSSDTVGRMDVFSGELIEKVKAAAIARLQASALTSSKKPAVRLPRLTSHFDKNQIIAIGASTGGTEAIAEVLSTLPSNLPPIVMTQHIPAKFSERFAQRLDGISAINVKEAEDGDVLSPGWAYLAPGDRHLVIFKTSRGYVCRLDNSEPVNRHKPSVDVMYRSILALRGCKATAILLTGMGKDGAKGMLELKEGGAMTIAQDERSCVVYGMPKAAVDLNAALKVVSLNRVAETLLAQLPESIKAG